MEKQKEIEGVSGVSVVTITGIDMSFFSMVSLIVKFTFAAFTAAIIVSVSINLFIMFANNIF